jgi:S1-C subfamily serine protease
MEPFYVEPTPSPEGDVPQPAETVAEAPLLTERVLEPTPTPSDAPRPHRRRNVVAPLLAVGLIAGVASSSGTYLALAGSGAFDRTATPAATAGQGGQAAQVAYTPTTGASDIDSATVDVVSAVTPSVVTVTAEVPSTGRSRFVAPTATAVGSGLVVDAAGLILTNRHVVEGATSLSVALSDGTKHVATVVKISDRPTLPSSRSTRPA